MLVFISHSSKDTSVARQLAHRLSEAGLKVWLPEDEILPGDNWAKKVFQWTNRRGVDVVVDNVGRTTLFGSIRSVRKGGRILIVGNTSGFEFELDIRYIFSKQISLIGSTMAPHAAASGARMSDVLSPTPPVLCLSTGFPSIPG